MILVGEICMSDSPQQRDSPERLEGTLLKGVGAQLLGHDTDPYSTHTLDTLILFLSLFLLPCFFLFLVFPSHIFALPIFSHLPSS